MSRHRGRGKMTKCKGCGAPMKALRGTIRPFCRSCAKNHYPTRKTKVIINLYKRIDK